MRMQEYILVRAEELTDSQSVTPEVGKRSLPPFDVLDAAHPPFLIIEESQISNAAEVHTHKGDLWFCLEGEVAFTCGGRLIDEKKVSGYDGKELSGSGIEGGTSFTLRKGDWLWIPPGVPHQHGATAPARLIIIKMPAAASA